MKSAVIGIASMIFSYFIVITKMSGFREMMGQTVTAGVLLFVMMIAMAVAIYLIVDTGLEIVTNMGPGDDMRKPILTIIISFLAIVVILLVGFLVPVIV